MSVGGMAPVEGVSVGGGAQVEEVSVGGGAPVGVVPLEVLLSENKQMLNNIMTVSSDSSTSERM